MFFRSLSQIVRAPSDGPTGDPAPAPAPASAPSTPAAEPPIAAALTDPAAPTDPAAAPQLPGALTDPAPVDPNVPPADPAAPVVIDPASYEVELPEGVTRDDPFVTEFLKGAADKGLDNATVKDLVKQVGPLLKDQLEAPFRAWQDMNNQWVAEVKADPQIGGAKLATSIQTIHAGIAAALPDAAQAKAVHEALRTTGAGNNLAIIRLLHAMSARLTEKPVVQGDGPVAPQQRSMAERLYPTHVKTA